MYLEPRPCSAGVTGRGMKRPLWVIGLAYAAGLLVAALAGLNTSLWLGVVCLRCWRGHCCSPLCAGGLP